MISKSVLKYNINYEGEQWHVVYTYTRHEKRVAEELLNKGYEVYLPLVNRIRRYERKIKRYEVPLINNYVFVKILKEHYINILNTLGVIKFLKNSGKISVIPQFEIDYLKLITGEIQNVEAQLLNNENLAGKEVMITEGPLFGLKGRVLEKSNNNTLIVTLENVGYALKFEVDTRIIKFTDKLKL